MQCFTRWNLYLSKQYEASTELSGDGGRDDGDDANPDDDDQQHPDDEEEAGETVVLSKVLRSLFISLFI
jgi:hypothetical protein